MSATFKCFHCQNEVLIKDKLGFREECSQCRSDLHVCKNCEFHDPKAYNECHETSADPVREKERANYCDFFQVRTKGLNSHAKADQLKAAAEALFKKN